MGDEENHSGPHDLDRAACLILLRSQNVGRIVVAGDDPYVALVNYVADEGGLVYRCDGGSVLAGLDGERVAFEVDVLLTSERKGWSVIARGSVVDVTDSLADDPNPMDPSPWEPGPKERWMRIRIEEITGRWVHGNHGPNGADDRGYL